MLRIEAEHEFIGGGVSPATPVEKRHADVTIHIREPLDPDRGEALKGQILALHGVINIRFSQKHTHLINVSYDPFLVNAGDILDIVRGHASYAYPLNSLTVPRDLHATLIGL